MGMVYSDSSDTCQLYGAYAASMPTRSVLPSPSWADVAAPAALPLSSPPWGAGPQPARNIMPPMPNAAMPESLRKSLRERMAGWIVADTVS